ncbi:hypothetical protein [Duganella aceris]|uniref:Transposase n=1 Tax=Duganella aceris TaxID=2703883 RepID=A0ABX0FSR9_9BURK|nr:hypothetical protein [Duganella aceris]NGZ87729.1 hypothetical protein [Duganella aceris]
MNAATMNSIPPAAYQALQDYLRRSRSPLSPAEAIDRAIRQWITHDSSAVAPIRGFQWKRLFLPETTRLRMHYDGDTHYAKVVGEEIIFRGRAVSPRQLTIAIAGDGRNAWRDLWILLPGERNWACAARLREQLDGQAVAPQSPAQAMTAAAKAMSESLNAALVLIEHVDHQTKTLVERRAPKHRREYDLLEDIH